MKRALANLTIIGILAILAQVFATTAHIAGDAASLEIADTYSTAKTEDPDARPQRGVPADLHCHGCFCASMPVPIVLARLPIALSAWPSLNGFRTGLGAGVDPPPPRRVT